MKNIEERNIQILDVRGLKCPLPVLRTQKCLGSLPSGKLLEVLCTDPMAVIDIPHLVQERGDTLVSSTTVLGVQTYLIRKA